MSIIDKLLTKWYDTYIKVVGGVPFWKQRKFRRLSLDGFPDI